MLGALNAIRADAAIPRDLTIPDPPSGETLDPSLLNLGICEANHEAAVTPQVQSARECGDFDRWYYDGLGSPAMIHLCEVTCETVCVSGATLFLSAA